MFKNYAIAALLSAATFQPVFAQESPEKIVTEKIDQYIEDWKNKRLPLEERIQNLFLNKENNTYRVNSYAKTLHCLMFKDYSYGLEYEVIVKDLLFLGQGVRGNDFLKDVYERFKDSGFSIEAREAIYLMYPNNFHNDDFFLEVIDFEILRGKLQMPTNEPVAVAALSKLSFYTKHKFLNDSLNVKDLVSWKDAFFSNSYDFFDYLISSLPYQEEKLFRKTLEDRFKKVLESPFLFDDILLNERIRTKSLTHFLLKPLRVFKGNNTHNNDANLDFLKGIVEKYSPYQNYELRKQEGLSFPQLLKELEHEKFTVDIARFVLSSIPYAGNESFLAEVFENVDLLKGNGSKELREFKIESLHCIKNDFYVEFVLRKEAKNPLPSNIVSDYVKRFGYRLNRKFIDELVLIPNEQVQIYAINFCNNFTVLAKCIRNNDFSPSVHVAASYKYRHGPTWGK